MPNIKSAKKRLRQDQKRRSANQAVRSRIKTFRKKFMQAAEQGDAAATQQAFQVYCSILDKAVKKGIVKKNAAVRRKTRASNRARSLVS